MNLSEIAAGTGGFAIDGEATYDYSGHSVSGAGDVNGDGLADLIVGSPEADFNGFFSGRSYVVFGKTGTAAVSLSAIAAGTGGFAINGESGGGSSGFSVSSAGDVNGDGLADLIVGAYYSEPNGTNSGRSYVVFGKTGTAAVELSKIAAGAGGFAVSGEAPYDRSGISVSAAGDVNGDGLADLIVGAAYADPSARNSGRSYVIFSPESPSSTPPPGVPASATYLAATLAGDGAGGKVAPVTELADARVKIDFSDDDSASGGGLNGASVETVTLMRSANAVQNIPGPLLPVSWRIGSDRAGFDSAVVTFKYLNWELASIGASEEGLTVFKAPALSGPWTPLPTAANAMRNEVSVTVNSLSFFAIRAPNRGAVEEWRLYE